MQGQNGVHGEQYSEEPINVIHNRPLPCSLLRFLLPEGAKKATYTPDTKLENAGTFTFLQVA
jgi:hypothetical protein